MFCCMAPERTLKGSSKGPWVSNNLKEASSLKLVQMISWFESDCFLFYTGFVDLQTERSDLLENVAAIPYLDYKHFALKIFFPEVCAF